MRIIDPLGRLMRWCLPLAEYSFDIRYKKGTQSWCADFASQMPTDTPMEDDNDSDDIPCCSVQEVDLTKNQSDYLEEIEYVFVTKARPSLESPMTALTRAEILTAQHTDEWCKHVRESVCTDSSAYYRESKNGVLITSSR